MSFGPLPQNPLLKKLSPKNLCIRYCQVKYFQKKLSDTEADIYSYG